MANPARSLQREKPRSARKVETSRRLSRDSLPETTPTDGPRNRRPNLGDPVEPGARARPPPPTSAAPSSDATSPSTASARAPWAPCTPPTTRRLDRRVALRVLHRDGLRFPERTERLLREGRARHRPRAPRHRRGLSVGRHEQVFIVLPVAPTSMSGRGGPWRAEQPLGALGVAETVGVQDSSGARRAPGRRRRTPQPMAPAPASSACWRPTRAPRSARAPWRRVRRLRPGARPARRAEGPAPRPGLRDPERTERLLREERAAMHLATASRSTTSGATRSRSSSCSSSSRGPP